MVDVVSSFTTLSARKAGEDRVSVLELDGAVIAVVADGAGGLGGGAEAAELVVAAVAELRGRVRERTPDSLERFLEEVDLTLAASPSAGETTAVVAVVAGGRVVGASVGDSEAWLLHGSTDPRSAT